MSNPTILVLAASLREQSDSRKLASVIGQIAESQGLNARVATLRDFDMPLYNQDVLDQSGMPPGAERLIAAVRDAAAVIIATPEYNYSVSGVLKNAFDWTSRARPMPWKRKPVLLTSASPSPCGGSRGLWQTRIPFEGCLAHVYPDMFALADSMNAFADGPKGATLKDDQIAQRLQTLINDFSAFFHRVQEK